MDHIFPFASSSCHYLSISFSLSDVHKWLWYSEKIKNGLIVLKENAMSPLDFNSSKI